MSTPMFTEVTSRAAFSSWRLVAPPLTVGLLLLGILFSNEIVAAVEIWVASTAYNHCFFIVPISLYLLWDRRNDLNALSPRPLPVTLLLAVPLGVIWLAAERLGIMEGRQLAALSLAQVLFLSLLGWQLYRAMSGPLLYLFFLAPFGEFLTPKLQTITTFFIQGGLDALGIASYIDGHFIEIPQGTFFVAEACAGFRFLIASIAFGCLYAMLIYRSPARRCVFIAVSIIVPVIANGFRALGIVYLGYRLGSAQAAAADHVIYGWLFFSIVILLLVALGLPFREDEVVRRAGTRVAVPAERFSTRGGLAVALGLVMIAAIPPAIVSGLNRDAILPISMPFSIDAGPDCVLKPTTQITGQLDGNAVLRCGEVAMHVTWKRYSPRITAGPLMTGLRRMVQQALTESLSETWLATEDGASSTWRILSSADPLFIMAASIWVEGRPVRPGLAMRFRMAIDSVVGVHHFPTVVTITPVQPWDHDDPMQLRTVQASLTPFLLAHPALDASIAGLTRIR